MTYPPSGGTPDPYQPQQPYGQQPPPDPTTPFSPDPYAAPGSGVPASGQPGPAYPPEYGQPSSAQPYGQQPAYGEQPGYGQQPPGYGQPPPYGQPAYGQQQWAPAAPTNTLAILALVFAFIFSPAAIVMGHLAKRQIRQTGEQGEGMATAGLWLGYIFTGLTLGFCALWGILLAAGIASSSTN
jgi:hypothetical protein